LKTFTEDIERLIATYNSNLQILDSKSAQDTTKALSWLTTLAQFVILIFTPLEYTYGILSIGGDLVLGGWKFWIFPVIAIPLICLIVMYFYLALLYSQLKPYPESRFSVL
jgi:hypothetical protein